jgi:uncharacterized protein (TIRG00374 family)
MALLARAAISVILLILVFRRVQPISVIRPLAELNAPTILSVLLIFGAFRVTQAAQMMAGQSALNMRFSLWELTEVGFIAGFYALILPASMISGAAASWYKLARPGGQYAEAGALVIITRLIFTLAILTFGLIGVWYDPTFSKAFIISLIVMSTVAVAFLALLSSDRGAHAMGRVMHSVSGDHRLPRALDRARAKVASLMQAFRRFDRRRLLAMFGMSMLSAVVGMLVWFTLARGLGIPLSFLTLAWICTVTYLIEFIPLTFAGLGLREGGLLLLLGRMGVPESTALTFAFGLFSLSVLAALVGAALEVKSLLLRRRDRHYGINDA